MADYIDLDLTADAEELRQDGRDWLTANAPAGFRISRLVDWVLGATARMAAEIVVLAGRVPFTIFQTFGQKVLKVPALDATAATGTVTVTAADNLGYTLQDASQIDIDAVGFITTADLAIPAGSTTGTVPVQAIIPGAPGSGLTGTSVQLVSPTPTWVTAVALSGITTGGIDGETGEEYVDRLADELPTLSPKAILIDDFAAIARSDIEVYRALAIDNFVPPSTTGVEGAVTVAVQSSSGGAISAGGKTRVETALEAARVLNLDVHVIDPTVNQIDVSFTATAHAGFDPPVVEAQAEQAVSDFLASAQWGRVDGGDDTSWVDEPTVRRFDLIGVVYAVPGIRHVTALTLAINGNALGTTDVTLTGPAAVTAPNTITGTVT